MASESATHDAIETASNLSSAEPGLNPDLTDAQTSFQFDERPSIIEMREAQSITYNWVDITADLTTAASHLALGELIHDVNFGLFEAMSAIEMMDPKMDAGMKCNQSERQIMGLEESIQHRGLKIKDIQQDEMISIIDNTLACIATWLEGHSLAQTVFTNLYTHNPDLIEDRCNRAFTLAVLKIVSIVKDKVIRAAVFEEEDFQSMTYGFKLAHNVTEFRVVGMLREVEEDCSRHIKITRSRQDEQRTTEMQLEHERCLAVQCRIKFLRLFFSALMATNKKEVRQGTDEAHRLFSQAMDCIPAIKRSVHLGNHSGRSDKQNNEKHTEVPLMNGFEPLVNQRLLPPTFPRYSKIIDPHAAIVYFEELIGRLRTVCEVTTYTSLHAIMDFVGDFSKQCPCVLSRSVLQLIFLPFNNKKIFGVETVHSYLEESVKLFILPAALLPKSPIYNNHHVREMTDGLLAHAVRPMLTMIQVQGHNRARQRDKLGQVLEELAGLQDEAEKVDTCIISIMGKTESKWPHQSCFGNWVMYHTIRTMLRYVLSGFELELYATHEYHYVYWYLADFLYPWFISTVTRADSILQDNEGAIPEPVTKTRSYKKKNKKRKIRALERELALAQAYQVFFSAYYKTVIAFTMEYKINRPTCLLDNEQVRFEHRFGVFSVILTPPLVQYETFCEMTDAYRTDVNLSPLDMYYMAYKLFVQSSLMLEKLSNQTPEMSVLIRVAKTNSVVIKLLMGGHKRDSKLPPQFDFTMHPIFPIVKLK